MFSTRTAQTKIESKLELRSPSIKAYVFYANYIVLERQQLFFVNFVKFRQEPFSLTFFTNAV
jgi:hypothetical protein